ncbi:lactonase family protein [Aquabacterium sp.]|uniref:lactonase family protein n=1 Tax=Aquabacterium sp. TaxID=1872578 RepID=UPI003D6CC2C5
MKTTRIALFVSSLIWASATLAHVHAHDSNVYVMSNAQEGNKIAVLKRSPEGRLSILGKYPTGGAGSGVGLTTPEDPLGSQNALVLSRDNQWLFAVNAGSNQVSAFRVQQDRLVLTGVANSGGRFPVSVAVKQNRIYVLNAGGEGNVTGFQVGRNGSLTPIPGSTRSLHTPTTELGPQPDILRTVAQAEFSPDGDYLVITDKKLDTKGSIKWFAYDDATGLLSRNPAVKASPDPLPFGFTFDRKGRLFVTEAVGGTVSSYRFSDDGQLNMLGRSVPNGQLTTCWIDGTNNYLYTSNTASNTLTGYSIERSGQLKLLNANGVAARLSDGHGPVDVKVSGDQAFLSVVNGRSGTVSSYRIEPSDGELVPADEIAVFPPLTGMVGLAAE